MKTTSTWRQSNRSLFGIGFFLCIFILITIVRPTSDWYQDQSRQLQIDHSLITTPLVASSVTKFSAKIDPSLITTPLFASTTQKPKPLQSKPYNESALAHRLLDGMKGIEIGASIHNPFGLNTVNVDYTDQMDGFRQEQIKLLGSFVKVDIVAPADKLPFTNSSQDFVINSHVLEHFYDPIKTIQEWLRVVRPGGYVFMVIPHKERTFDAPRNRTTLPELLERQNSPSPATYEHHSVWVTADVLELCLHFKWKVAAALDVDDKVGNGFIVVIQK